MPHSKTPRPNVVFILSDDQGFWAMRCAGNPEIRTPSLDRLAASGMLFERFFCASPVCSPARASILTGRIPSQHGVHDWIRAGDTIAKYEPLRGGELVRYLDGIPAYTEYLAAAGYVCAISGKWHLGDCHHPQKGFSCWRVHAMGGGPYYGAPMLADGEIYEDPRYVTDVITDNALAFIDDQMNASAPFHLNVHYTAPHSPWGREHHPPEIHDDYFNNCAFDSVPRNAPRADWIEYRSIPVDDDETRRKHLSGYFAAVTAMDAGIGRILDRLDETGIRSSTLVCFMSDNGMNMGHHGVFGKGNATFPLNMYEESVRVPCIMSHPSVVPQGAACGELLSQYDFMPTILEYADVENPDAETLPGRSFADVLKGGNRRRNDHVVVYDEYGPVRMVRTRDWKYVHRYPYGPNELYNLAEDPGETRNLVDNASCGRTLAELREKLADWFQKYVNSEIDGTKEPVTGAGQIGFAGVRSHGRPAYPAGPRGR
ncbi:MAG TPA: DUF4976 domain-containing protein [Planctomycetes bacterium]|nr:DUF4976 domain-containing protein [Planctomycetota bacterium]